MQLGDEDDDPEVNRILFGKGKKPEWDRMDEVFELAKQRKYRDEYRGDADLEDKLEENDSMFQID